MNTLSYRNLSFFGDNIESCILLAFPDPFFCILSFIDHRRGWCWPRYSDPRSYILISYLQWFSSQWWPGESHLSLRYLWSTFDSRGCGGSNRALASAALDGLARTGLKYNGAWHRSDIEGVSTWECRALWRSSRWRMSVCPTCTPWVRHTCRASSPAAGSRGRVRSNYLF